MKKSLNLNPKSIEESSKDKESRVLVVLYLTLTLILCLNVFAIFLDNDSLKKESSLLKNQIDNLKSDAGDYENLEKKIKLKENFISKVEKLENSKDYEKYISDIGKYIPQNTYITSAVYNDALITLNGIAKNEDEVAEFLANLQMSDDYSHAELLNMNKVEEYELTSNNNIYNEDIGSNEVENGKKSSEQETKSEDNMNKEIDKSSNKLNENKIKESPKVEKIQFTINIKE